MSVTDKILQDMQKMNYADAKKALDELIEHVKIRKTLTLRRERRLRRLYRGYMTIAKNHQTTIDEILIVGRGLTMQIQRGEPTK